MPINETAIAPPSPKKRTFPLALGAMGVVFGDIGTSPLYALKVCFDPVHGLPLSTEGMYGVLSMVFWAFILVVTIKYILFVLRAHNQGEGGVLALMAMALRAPKKGSRSALFLLSLGVLGACMFYGDAVITPAISVLSAVEGLDIISPELKEHIIPLTIGVLVVLFIMQKHGTSMVGFLFGPIMLIWFLTLACLGLPHLIHMPSVLLALNPYYAFHFIIEHPLETLAVLGAVFLVLTGAEALYADMGHFGARPIRLVWLSLTMPCLLLNYFGQGALILTQPEAIKHPFFLMVPDTYTWALVGIATLATVIASQATISGVYSMTRQAILLGLLPRMKIVYTSEKERGQIYMPTINWMLFFVIIWVVTMFQESENLAAAYGIAVSMTMLTTTLLAAVVMKHEWKWPLFVIILVIGLFALIDVAFLSANLLKVAHGGWLTLALGGITFFLLMTWHQCRDRLRKKMSLEGIPLEGFIESLLKSPPVRVEGSAIFLTTHVGYVPIAMLHNLKHNQVLHRQVLFLKISVWDVPYVDTNQHLTLNNLGQGIYVAKAVYGFKETPDVNEILKLTHQQYQLVFDVACTSFFLPHYTIAPSTSCGMVWRLKERIFAWMFHNSAKPSDFFKIPTNRVVELGAKIEIS